MELTISYSQTQMQEAAKFIWEKNPSIKNWPSAPDSVFDVFNIIHRMAVRDARKNYELILKERKTGSMLDNEWITYSGTGGFYLTYELIVDEENEIQIGVEVSVNPSIGMRDNTEIITELLDYTEEEEV